MILDKQSIFEIKIIFDIQKMTNLWEFKVLNLFLLRSRPGSNRGPCACKRETLRNDLILSYFTYMISSQKSKLSNLNNFKIGGSSWKPKLSANSPITDGSRSIIGFEEDPPDFRAIKLRKSISYAKSAYFMKLGLYPSS